MPIVSSSYTTSDPQIDGRVWVYEVQTFDDGSTQNYDYLADPTDDFQSIANDRAAAINAALDGD